MRSSKAEPEHFADEVFFDNLGEGIRISCDCGWMTEPCPDHESAGGSFDCHLNNSKPKEARDADKL